MGEGEAAERRKARRSGGGARCVSSGELSIIKPLFGLVNRSHSHKLDAPHTLFKTVHVGIELDFFSILSLLAFGVTLFHQKKGKLAAVLMQGYMTDLFPNLGQIYQTVVYDKIHKPRCRINPFSYNHHFLKMAFSMV